MICPFRFESALFRVEATSMLLVYNPNCNLIDRLGSWRTSCGISDLLCLTHQLSCEGLYEKKEDKINNQGSQPRFPITASERAGVVGQHAWLKEPLAHHMSSQEFPRHDKIFVSVIFERAFCLSLAEKDRSCRESIFKNACRKKKCFFFFSFSLSDVGIR